MSVCGISDALRPTRKIRICGLVASLRTLSISTTLGFPTKADIVRSMFDWPDASPDLAYEDILKRERVGAGNRQRGAGRGDGSGFRSTRQEPSAPAVVVAESASIVTFTVSPRRRRAPDRQRLALLQNHVIAKDDRQFHLRASRQDEQDRGEDVKRGN